MFPNTQKKHLKQNLLSSYKQKNHRVQVIFLSILTGVVLYGLQVFILQVLAK